MSYIRPDIDDSIIEIVEINFYDTFTKTPSRPMRDWMDTNNVPYRYYYYSRDSMPSVILEKEVQYDCKFPVVAVTCVVEISEYFNKVDEDGEYVFEEKEDGYIYPVLEEVKFTKRVEIVYDNIEQLNKSKLLDKIKELGVTNVPEED